MLKIKILFFLSLFFSLSLFAQDNSCSTSNHSNSGSDNASIDDNGNDIISISPWVEMEIIEGCIGIFIDETKFDNKSSEKTYSNIKFSLPEGLANNENYSFQVTDSTGERLLSGSLNSTYNITPPITLNSMVLGTYYVRLYSDDESYSCSTQFVLSKKTP